MDITYAFAGLAVVDYGVAYDWYIRFFGRPADTFPHDKEAVWRLTPNGSVYVVQEPERAGRGRVTLALNDLDACERRLHDEGFAVTVEPEGAAPRRLVVEDLDGNMLTLFQDPAASGSCDSSARECGHDARAEEA